MIMARIETRLKKKSSFQKGGITVPSYYLGIDQGTTLTTALLADEKWNIVAKASKAHRQYYPAPGWVEHDPMEIYENCLAAAAAALAKIPNATAGEIRGMGLDHQGETCMIWDKNSGEPIYRAIVWQDRRTADAADDLKRRYGEKIHRVTGVLPDAYHSATKFRWILDHVEGAQQRAERGELLLGTLNTWLIWKLTGGTSYATDPSSGSCTMLMDIHKTEWSPEILSLVGLSGCRLPEICDCNHIFGYTAPGAFPAPGIPIAGSLTDSPAGLIGGGCLGKGILKTSYGTGSFMSLQTGGDAILSDRGLFTSCLWRLSGKPYYRLFGSAYTAGAAVGWLKDGLGIIKDVGETEQMALSVPDTNDVCFVPAFSGLATPYWDQYARGLFIGLTGGVTREHLVRAVLESMAYQVANCYEAMRREFGQESPVMRADGGMTENRFVMQFQADMLGIPVEVPEEKETAAFGAACLAGYTLGALPSLESVREFVRLRNVYEPRMSADERKERLSRWLEAVDRSRAWVKKGT